MGPGSSVVGSSSVNSDMPSPTLAPYAATKAAIANFSASLAQLLGEKGIRVNSVAPGPIWTPLIPATMPEEKVANFGDDTPLGRAGQPAELAPVYVLLASDEGSYISGAPAGGRPDGGCGVRRGAAPAAGGSGFPAGAVTQMAPAVADATMMAPAASDATQMAPAAADAAQMAQTADSAAVGPLLAYSQEDPDNYGMPLDSIEELICEHENEAVYTEEIAPPTPRTVIKGREGVVCGG